MLSLDDSYSYEVFLILLLLSEITSFLTALYFYFLKNKNKIKGFALREGTQGTIVIENVIFGVT